MLFRSELPYRSTGAADASLLARARAYRMPRAIEDVAAHEEPMTTRQRMNLPLVEQPDPDPPSAPCKVSCRNEAVTAVVSRTAKNRDASEPRRHVRRRVGNRTPGILHQRQAGNAGGHRRPVRVPHLPACQQPEASGADTAITRHTSTPL